MTAPSFLKKLLSDPPPRFAFEISESGIAAARIAAPPEIGFQPLDPDVIAVSPVHDNVQRMEALTEQVRALFGLDHAGLNAAVAAAPAGAGGLVLLPYLAGERTPNVPEGSGVLLGLTNQTFSAGHLARAAM